MRRRDNAGFTLLEVTVSLAIAALALGALTHLVNDAARLDARLSERLRRLGETEALSTVLRELLADPQRELSGEALRLTGGAGGPSVSGAAKAITIVSQGSRVLGLTDPTPFTITFDADSTPNRGRILLAWATAEGASETEVIAHARDFGLRYAAASEGGQLTWTDRWTRPVAMLALVEASYVEPESGRRVVRLIPVSAKLPRICALQPLLEGCPEWR